MSDKPNVLLINVDHWAASMMGCSGNKEILTPTLNEIAQNGVMFDRCFSTCPVSIPARRSLMTGLSPCTHGDRVYNEYLKMPKVKTMAQAFRDSGYQAYAVGKLHVYPQRDRIGFDDVLLSEEGRYEFGTIDDYQIWLGENGYLGKEYMHGMGNNQYYTRPWHLPEEAHHTNWATKEMINMIKRKDPMRPGFYYISYIYPHPPLVPLKCYLDMYNDLEVSSSPIGNWAKRLQDNKDKPKHSVTTYGVDEGSPLAEDDILDIYMNNGISKISNDINNTKYIKIVENIKVVKKRQVVASKYNEREKVMAKKAFYALCTHIDNQIRLLIGTLKEEGLLENTIIAFTSDHGDMLFDHNMVGKGTFYRNSTNIPLIITGRPMEKMAGTISSKLACLEDIMPTLLGLCGIDIPKTVEGINLFSEKRDMLFGEIYNDELATRMVTDGKYKLIYYPYGNKLQLFDLREDPNDIVNIAKNDEYSYVLNKLKKHLIEKLNHGDEKWVINGELVGVQLKDEDKYPERYSNTECLDYSLSNQRGGHWPPPTKK